MHRQIAALTDQIRRAVIIPDGPDASGKIRLGSTVTVQYSGAQKTYHIVGPAETDPNKGRISHVSPLGAALIGHAAGEKVTLKTSRGTAVYTIVNVG